MLSNGTGEKQMHTAKRERRNKAENTEVKDYTKRQADAGRKTRAQGKARAAQYGATERYMEHKTKLHGGTSRDSRAHRFGLHWSRYRQQVKKEEANVRQTPVAATKIHDAAAEAATITETAAQQAAVTMAGVVRKLIYRKVVTRGSSNTNKNDAVAPTAAVTEKHLKSQHAIPPFDVSVSCLLEQLQKPQQRRIPTLLGAAAFLQQPAQITLSAGEQRQKEAKQEKKKRGQAENKRLKRKKTCI